MKTHEFGKSDTVLIQPVGKHELPWIENEVREIHRLTSADFKYIAVEIDDGESVKKSSKQKFY